MTLLFITLVFLCVLLILFFKKGKSIAKLYRPKKTYYSIDDEYNAKRKEKEMEIDKLLAKMGKNGLNDLNKQERKRLDELSKK